ncbi:hypothetical protein [Leucobacter sp. OH1287]|uniref:hypothetical protein n=1 Tax=Leucobacter sp. OH1287 TaxID=2491049 RepID=UPI0013159A64|nr:hypothetical protein [Leucobacter sp. OH1287]
MYADFFWPQLNDALAELRDNNTGNGIMALADNYYSRDSAGKYTFSDSAFQTISCTDNGTSEPFDQDAAVKKLPSTSRSHLSLTRVRTQTAPSVASSQHTTGATTTR